jgi:hypothetical protein
MTSGSSSVARSEREPALGSGPRIRIWGLQVLAWLIGITMVIAAVSAHVYRRAPASVVSADTAPTSKTERAASQSVVAGPFEIKAVAERGESGKIYIAGTTNFPDGMKMWVELGAGKAREAVFVKGGRFRTETFEQGATISGKQPVEFIACFNSAWQNKEVLSVLGYGGRELKGDLFKAIGTETTNRDKILDAKFSVVLPPISTGAGRPASAGRQGL